MAIFFSGYARGQTPFVTMDSIDANRINAAVLVHGDMWWNPVTKLAQCKFPADSKKHVGFAASLWMSGYDNAGQLRVAAQTYRQDGSDYWPGPLDASGALDYATSEKWARIWKVRRSDIETHKAITFRRTDNTPEPILTWPARGNAYARGNNGVPLVIAEDMAPFVDLNGDGIYQPLKGEYPDIRGGEQGLWWCFSDNGPTHGQTGGTPMKMQVHAMAFAYKRNTLIDYVVYHEYTVVNKSGNDYQDMRMAIWDDADLGYYLDDFIGFDSAKRMAIVYNGTNDDGLGAGHPANSYGLNPPARGVTIVSAPGDGGGTYVPAGNFIYHSNDPSVIWVVSDTVCRRLMRPATGSGRHGVYNWSGGGGWDTVHYGSYIYPDDPGISGGCSELAHGDNPGNRRYVLATKDFTLNAGAKTRMVIALVVDSAAKGAPNLLNFDGIREVADTAWRNYHALHVAVPEVREMEDELKVYPNPAGNTLHIDARSGKKQLTIYNAMGQRIYDEEREEQVCEVDISKYPAGMYVLQCSQEGISTHITFIKH